ncbi:hypothetical protein K438DRAFT_1770057 [Mycena galopus ATCC 62051]|nr:hypothetical protein K438DRAFT_1770057 [Mycena galopus ATCC 62051]
MGVYDDPFGSIVIGSWVASILFGAVLVESFRYFSRYPKDTIAKKTIVVSSLFFCSAALVADYANTYLYWPVPMYVMMNTCAGVVVNSFLIRRFYTLSNNMVVSILLCLFLIVGIAGSILVAIMLHIFSAFSALQRDKAKIMINRLILQTVQTGSTTSLVSIATLISYIIKNDSNVPTALYYLAGPLYLLTLFSNLNRRGHDNISGSGRSTSEGHSAVRMDGIHVHRAAIVTVDPERSVAQDTRYKDPDTESYRGKKVPEL